MPAQAGRDSALRFRPPGGEIAPVYVGQQIKGPGRHNVSGAQGTVDGQDAARLMSSEEFAAGSFVYLDLEDGPPFISPRTDYVSAWTGAVSTGGFQPGIYCSHGFASNIHSLQPTARITPTHENRRRSLLYRFYEAVELPPYVAELTAFQAN